MRRPRYERKYRIREADTNVQSIIDELINTKWSGSNEEQMKAVQLLKGLATSDDPAANRFMQKLDDFTSTMKSESLDEAASELIPRKPLMDFLDKQQKYLTTRTFKTQHDRIASSGALNAYAAVELFVEKL